VVKATNRTEIIFFHDGDDSEFRGDQGRREETPGEE